MTRLKESDICTINNTLENYNLELVMKTGHTLSEIAAHAVGLSPHKEGKVLNSHVVGVIPMTSGLGVIGGFSETVAEILSFLGMKAFVTQQTDVKGVAEALDRNAEILFMADDDRFIGLHLKSGYYSDNCEATGKGYTAALDFMVEGLEEKKVLIIGAGSVGCAAAFSVLQLGGSVHIYDKNLKVCEALAAEVYQGQGIRIIVEEDLHTALKSHRLIIDACPAGGFIKEEHLTTESYIAAPGVPLGIEDEAIAYLQPRLVHDPLQLGVATMLFDILANTD